MKVKHSAYDKKSYHGPHQREDTAATKRVTLCIALVPLEKVVHVSSAWQPMLVD